MRLTRPILLPPHSKLVVSTPNQARNNKTIVGTIKILLKILSKMAASYVPTAEMPLMKGIRAELVQALDEKKSLFEVTLMLGDVVKDLGKVQWDIAIKKTIESFDEDMPLMRMASLLHYMNVKLLRSVIAGTLAYDLYQDADLGANCQYNENSSPGTYVVSLSIKGRQGKFLNIRELGQLADLVDDYAQAADLWANNDKAWDDKDARHAQGKEFTKEVDSKVGRAEPDGMPRFGDNKSAIHKLRELARMFRRRVDVSLDIQNKGETYQTQAPAMVGCTTETIGKRTKAHVPQWSEVNPLHPAANSLQSTTKTWALTLSLLYYMNLRLDIVHVAALPFFDASDLSRTEMLLTTLARSLVWQDGFNVIQGGGRSDDISVKRGYEEQRNVCHAKDFLKNNLSATLQRIQEVRIKIAIAKNLKKVDLDALETEINKLKAEENELQLRVNDFDKTKSEFMERYKEAKETVDLEDELLKEWRGWYALLDCIEEDGA